MVLKHNNEPRDIGYGKEFAEYFQKEFKGTSLIHPDSKTIFAGKRQKDLFIFAMALGRYSNQKSAVKNKQNNIPVQALSESQKWTILSLSISNKGIICLKDEAPLYELSEQYANEGMKILKSHMDKWGSNYPKALEADLKEIFENPDFQAILKKMVISDNI